MTHRRFHRPRRRKRRRRGGGVSVRRARRLWDGGRRPRIHQLRRRTCGGGGLGQAVSPKRLLPVRFPFSLNRQFNPRRFNPRRAGGGGRLNAPLFRFVAKNGKNGGAARGHFSYLFTHPFPTLSEKFSARSFQVRYLPLRRGYSFTGILFQELIRATVPTNCISRNFDFGDLMFGQFSDQVIRNQWENVQMFFIPKVREGSS